MKPSQAAGYACWLSYDKVKNPEWAAAYRAVCGTIVMEEPPSGILHSARSELAAGLTGLLGEPPQFIDGTASLPEGIGCVLAGTWDGSPEIRQAFGNVRPDWQAEGYAIRCLEANGSHRIVLAAPTEAGVLYAAFHLLRLMQTGETLATLELVDGPRNRLRMINHWDNMDGSIERGYAGRSILYRNQEFRFDPERITDYARLLASIGLNAVSINNVNVHRTETRLITAELLPQVARLADTFRAYGIRLYLSVNFAAPMEIGGLATADPLDGQVREWWSGQAAEIYRHIPDFGGFVVKADSEFRPGPFTYGRNHADGANMLAEALKPFGGLVVWRCFVYNCLQDWRDRSTDRAKAAYDHFMPLDGHFADNVLLQVKNGPMDFQVREPVSPLFGGLQRTNQLLELQITQEYTGQQKHVCYLVPQWKEVLDFDTYARGEDSTVAEIACGRLFGRPIGGMAAVSNIGDDPNWTGHLLAQANWYGFGRLAWDPALSTEQITREWISLTFGNEPQVVRSLTRMLLSSWPIYESYTAPLGVGWMVNPGHHYGPNVDGYEYSKWGTYHFADCRGIGVDRTVRSGTGYTAQYHEPNAGRYESLETCPDDLLLFFHHVPYTHRLHSGKTVIQHIYDSHFDGALAAERLVRDWEELAGHIDPERHGQVLERLRGQAEHAKEWRDVINTYFLRKSGIADEQGRTIYS